MTSISKRTWGVLSIGLLAAFLTAVFKSMDNITVHHFITSPDRISAAFAYLVIGSWTIAITTFVFATLFGRLLDSGFKGITVLNMKMHQRAFLAGLFSAASTLFLLLGNQFGDPSALAALSGATLIYTGVYDVATRRTTLRLVLFPILVTAIGGSLAAFNGSLALTGISVLLVLVLSNGFGATAEILEQQGVHASNPLSLMAWRFLWMAVLGTTLALGISALRGTSAEFQAAIGHGVQALPFIILTMSVVFFAIGLKMVLKKTSLVSIVLLVLSTQVLFSYPITILGEIISPGLFGGIPTAPWIWLVRATGAALLILGALQIKKIDIAVKTAN